MPLVIKTKSMKALIVAYRKDWEASKRRDKDLVDWGELTEAEATRNEVNRTAILKILEEVASKKTTQIKVEQIPLFKL